MTGVQTRILRFCCSSLWPLHHEDIPPQHRIRSLQWILIPQKKRVYNCVHKSIKFKNLWNYRTIFIELRTSWLYFLLKDKTDSHLIKKECPGYDTKLHLMMRLQFWRVWSTPSFSLLPSPLRPGVEAAVRVPSIGQID